MDEDKEEGESSESVGLLSGKKDTADEADVDEGPAPRSRADFIALLAFALPLALTRGSQGAMQQTNVMFVGHLGVVELGAGASGNLWATIVGRSIINGGLSALDSLASQSYGAKDFVHVGTLTQRAILIVTLLCIPIGFAWIWLTGPVLTAAGGPSANIHADPRLRSLAGRNDAGDAIISAVSGPNARPDGHHGRRRRAERRVKLLPRVLRAWIRLYRLADVHGHRRKGGRIIHSRDVHSRFLTACFVHAELEHLSGGTACRDD
jgi:hypothetical protein